MQLTSSVQGHSSCSCVVVLVPSGSFDYLLCHNISGRKEHLCEFRKASSWERDWYESRAIYRSGDALG